MRGQKGWVGIVDPTGDSQVDCGLSRIGDRASGNTPVFLDGPVSLPCTSLPFESGNLTHLVG